MKRERSIFGEILSVTISLAVAIITASSIVGEQARLVMVITIVACSLAAGISAGVLIEKIKNRKNVSPEDSFRRPPD